MPKLKVKPGDRVKIVKRQVTKEDRESSTYFAHLAGLTGTVQNVYSDDEIAVQIDPGAFPPLLQELHAEAVRRMQAKFLDSLSEEQRNKLSEEEKKFHANFVVLVGAKDLERGPKTAPKVKAKGAKEPEDYDGTSVRHDIVYDDESIPDTPSRKSFAELEVAEEEEIRRRNKKTAKRFSSR